MDDRMKIGEVAERVGLSLRTIRFYEEAGLITPDGRSVGGFRLYTDLAVERLRLIMAMKPLDLSVEEIAEVLGDLDAVTSDATPAVERRAATERLAAVRELVEVRVARLLDRVERAREFAAMLDDLRDQQPGRPA